MRRAILTALSLSLSSIPVGCDADATSAEQAQIRSNPNELTLAELGEAIFVDEDLSVNFNQACTGCHDSETGFTGPDLAFNLEGGIYEGSVHDRFGGRKAPSSAYNVFAPVLSLTNNRFVGGNFFDGRATGWRLGVPAADQAQGPFLNPVEQALADGSIVVERVCDSWYKVAFKWQWGVDACKDSEFGYDAVAFSITAYETSPASSRFTSKYDAYLQGEATLTAIEEQGLALFEGDARCFRCHDLDDEVAGVPGPLFTDFTYHNLGIPRNLDNPFYRMDDVEVDGVPINPLGFDWIDPGLGGFLEQLIADDEWRSQPYVPGSMSQLSDQQLGELAQSSRGKHKVPTLRNVELRPFPSFVKSYGHNGYFNTLEGLVHFYNTRDVLPTCVGDLNEADALALDCWPAPEVAENVNTGSMGNLGLSPAEEAAVVAFLRTLSDELPAEG